MPIPKLFKRRLGAIESDTDYDNAMENDKEVKNAKFGAVKRIRIKVPDHASVELTKQTRINAPEASITHGLVFQKLPTNIQRILLDYENVCRVVPARHKTDIPVGVKAEIERSVANVVKNLDAYRRQSYCVEFMEWCATHPIFGEQSNRFEVNETKVLLYTHFHLLYRKRRVSKSCAYVATNTVMSMMGICSTLQAWQVTHHQNQNGDVRNSRILRTYRQVIQKYRDVELNLVTDDVKFIESDGDGNDDDEWTEHRPVKIIKLGKPLKKSLKGSAKRSKLKKRRRQVKVERKNDVTETNVPNQPSTTTIEELKRFVWTLADELKSLTQKVDRLLEQNSQRHQTEKMPEAEEVALLKPDKSMTTIHDFWQKWCDAMSPGLDPQLPAWSVAFMPAIRLIQDETLASDGDISMVLNDLEFYRLRQNLSLDDLVKRVQSNEIAFHE
jgi:hypothetical protein